MFALTLADGSTADVHLSDGGHFENLALYELVRRHCRYIVVSDCGEDPAVAFDDFGNAARRIREDFGVDIDVDLSALRAENRRSRQHVVVGTIRYSDFDKGIVLYVKPTLTGDEPPDLLQYETRNTRFPHEPTTDQFYDEAQWESYRKLGEHSARVAFGFVERYRGASSGDGSSAAAKSASASAPPVDWIFTAARLEWYPTPPRLAASVLEMTERFGVVESEVQREGAASVLGEIFPELHWMQAGEVARDVLDPAVQAANLTCLIRIIQLMEDVYGACELDEHWTHPLNLGWTNCFSRWASAPTFRMWWPLLRPMYGPEFQRFMQERFRVLEQDARPGNGEVTGPYDQLPPGLAAEWWSGRTVMPTLDGGGSFYAHTIDLHHPGREKRVPMQVGLARVRQLDASTAWWTNDDFFIPPSLWGGGFGADFLCGLVTKLRPSVRNVRVYVRAPARQNDPGSWADRVTFIEFYKAHGFQIQSPEEEKLPDGVRCRAVHLERSTADRDRRAS
jgi:hypothetical protein